MSAAQGPREAVLAWWRAMRRGELESLPFAFAGVATDVLVLRDGRWRYQAHHVSMDAPGG